MAPLQMFSIFAVFLKNNTDISSLSKDELIVEVMSLQHRLSLLEKMIFGPKRERFISALPADKDQLSLGMNVAPTEQVEVKQTVVKEHQRTEVKKKKSHPGRHALPANLRREEIILEPDEDVSDCVRIGEEITEVLEVNPAEFYVKRYIRGKYARKNEEGVAIAPLPARIIDKGIAGASVLAMLIISKFIDHLPVHRQVAIFKRIGVELKYNTVLDWGNQCLDILTPLYELLKKRVFQRHYIQADETGIKVLDHEVKGRSHKGFLWAYRSVEDELIFFEYQPGRNKEGPGDLLRNFTGYLQTDGYAAYNQFNTRKDIQTLCCMAHARRYFKEAEDNDKERAAFALKHFQKLYEIEREIKELSPQERQLVRQEKSLPILSELESWMQEQYKQITPKSAIGKALAYSLKRWEQLKVYTSNGILEIDNNRIENDIRPIALGRKNFLFAGSHESAQRIAMIYSLLGTCKAKGVDPLKWLTHVFEQIPHRKVNDLEDLLPQTFKSNM